MDKIFLRGMHLETLIGVYEWERQNRQSLVFNLEIGLKDTFKNNDEISETVHYGVVHERLRQHLHEQQFLLLESLANDVAQFFVSDICRNCVDSFANHQTRHFAECARSGCGN